MRDDPLVPRETSSFEAESLGGPARACTRCGAPLIADRPHAGRLTERWSHFPFCSDRCRWIDLGLWLTDSYAVPGATGVASESDPEE